MVARGARPHARQNDEHLIHDVGHGRRHAVDEDGHRLQRERLNVARGGVQDELREGEESAAKVGEEEEVVKVIVVDARDEGARGARADSEVVLGGGGEEREEEGVRERTHGRVNLAKCLELHVIKCGMKKKKMP